MSQAESIGGGQKGLSPYLHPFSVWALSFGCAVGWGSFVMPGTTFLPKAGPIGTAIGIMVGAFVMFIIGVCYFYLMKRFPDAGGTFSFASGVLGHDHGFLAAWFLILVYVAIIWANATALVLMARYLFGDLFQFGFHYQIFGYDVYFGEVLLTLAALILVALLLIFGKIAAGWLQTILAVLLIAGIIVCFAGVMMKAEGRETLFTPAFAPGNELKIHQIFSIVILSPWAFSGFESVSHSTEEFRFPVKKTIGIMIGALICGAISYVLLTFMASTFQPSAYASWTEYIKALPGISGVEGLPTFFATREAMGELGVKVLGVTMLAGIMTGLVGNYIASSRLLFAMSRERILPKWFGKLNAQGTPRNAVLFLMLISLIIPFLGRTAIGWIVDVTTIGATLAYTYVSVTAFALARKEKKRGIQVAATLGILFSIAFFVYFMALSKGALATESYLILAAWAILGFVYFRIVFSRNEDRRLGKSVVVWIGLLFLIFFTTLMWVKQSTDDMTEKAIGNVSEYYEKMNPDSDIDTKKQTKQYLAYQLYEVDRKMGINSAIQLFLIIGSLAIMFSIYTIMGERARKAEGEKVRAEESSVAKSAFLANMSHDIRTPMNAIIGYLALAERDGDDPEKVKKYLAGIKTSSNHLLNLINEVLEMSRIESGRIDLDPSPLDLKSLLEEIREIFTTQMNEKELAFSVVDSYEENRCVLCDRNSLNRVLMNLVSNAYKYTEKGGSVALTLRETGKGDAEKGAFEISVRDTGIGMTPEFAEKVFDPFEREESSTLSGIQGTGLGMSITKSIVESMGGTITVQSEKGVGTEFVIHLTLPYAEDVIEQEEKKDTGAEERITLSGKRILLVEDIEVNREIAKMLLSGQGILIDTAENGEIAVEAVKEKDAGYYDAILMDIQMPVMDGYEATKAIRALEDAERANTPIIAMTANAFAEDMKMAREAGMNAHIPKPIDLKVILKTLSDILGGEKQNG